MTQIIASTTPVKGGKIWERPQLVRTPGYKRVLFASVAFLGLTVFLTGLLLTAYWVPTLFSSKIVNKTTFLFNQPNFPYIFWMLILVIGGLGVTIAGIVGCFPFIKTALNALFVLGIIAIVLLCLPNLASPIIAQNTMFTTTWLAHENGLKPLPTSDPKLAAEDSSLDPSAIANNKPIQMINKENQIVNVTFRVTPGKIQIKQITPAATPNLG